MPATTPNLALPYPVATDTADVPRDIQALAVKLDTSSGGGIGATLPASPVDGQIFHWLVDATNGVIWQMRYRTAASKWEFIGGPPMAVFNVTTDTTNSTAYIALGTGHPSVVLPTFTGTMDVVISHSAQLVPAVNDIASASVKISAGAPSDNDAFTVAGAPTAFVNNAGSRMMRRTGLPSGQGVQQMYRTASGGTLSVLRREVLVWPVRVG